MQVIWKRLYNASSAMDGATLYQLRNIINRRNITKSPSGNVTACEEFFLLVTEAHILSAAMTVFQMQSLDDVPKSTHFRHGSSNLSDVERNPLMQLAARDIITRFVDMSFGRETPLSQPDDGTMHMHVNP